MKDINNELEQILIKNKIIKGVSLEKTIHQVCEFKMKISESTVIGLYGAGMEADSLLHFLVSYIPNLKIDVCFDKTVPTYTFYECIREKKVHRIEEIVNSHVDYILLGSYAYRDEMKQTLCRIGFKGKIVDFYDTLGEYIDDHYANYEMIFKIHQKMKESNNEKLIELIRQLIKAYLNIKDFENTRKYIDFYVENQFPEYKRYSQLKKDIDNLIQSIQEYLRIRNEKDIIVNWVDALPHNKIDQFPFIKKVTEKGASFENAYTVMPWTRGTLRTILYGEYPITDMMFLREHYISEEVKTIKLLEKYNYKFAYCGLTMYAKDFDNKVIMPWNIYTDKCASSVIRQWDAISLMCRSEQPLLILIHTLYETHGPYICGEADTFIRFTFQEKDWEDDRCKKQAEISGKYIDKQLAFYNQLYGKNAYRIYMSDHGNVGDCIMEDHKVHIVFSILHEDIQHQVITGMFSLVEFPQVIEMLLKETYNWKELERGEVMVETYDAYDERKVQEILEGKLDKRNWLQCRGIITKQDKYFLYADGEEYYFRMGNEKVNYIKDINYSQRISLLKQKCSASFIDIFKYDQFQNARKLYKE